MRINTNVPALQSYNALTAVNSNLQKSIQKLSAGLRINSAADDAAGLAISEKMRAQVNGLNQAVNNSQDGVSMIQTAEGALNEVHSILQRMRELSVQAANETLTAGDRMFIQYEIDELRGEADRIASTTQFNRKQLLDGSSSVIWSTDNLDTRVLVRGALSGKPGEGNYKVSVRAVDAGEAEVQKSHIFYIKHKNVAIGVVNNKDVGTIESLDDYPPGDFTADVKKYTVGDAYVQQSYGLGALPPPITVDYSAITLPRQDVNASVLLEVVGVDNDTGWVRFSCQSTTIGYDGETRRFTDDNLIITAAGISGIAAGDVYDKLGFDLPAAGISIPDFTEYDVGDKMVMKFTWNMNPPVDYPDDDMHINIAGKLNQDWEYAWDEVGPNGADTLYFDNKNEYNFAPSLVSGKTVQVSQYFLNPFNGSSFEGSVNIRFADGLDSSAVGADGETMGSMRFTSTFIGQIADERVKLRDIREFWDANGRFMLNEPKELTVMQGDGARASVTLYSSDTLGDVTQKLNQAIANSLGQGAYLKGVRRLSSMAGGAANTHESVLGTLLLRSIIPGGAGRLTLSADEDILNAFGFNVIQSAREARYEAVVTDAHSGNSVNRVRFSGNIIEGAIDPNIDIVFSSMMGIRASWNEKTLKYDLLAEGIETRIVHLTDNTTYLQVGANELERFSLSIAALGSEALGLRGIAVTDRESAARAVTAIDGAIGRVSSQRAMLGAYQNRLEHAINNLTAAGQNTTQAESRIRDADMAKEMMEFTKLNILSQAGTSMLAQANQLPQNILSLLRQ
ncbi:flagellin [Synergistales bacterium]|nr:flagellin [Synergistales bacterium]